MATLGEMLIKIGGDTGDFDKSIKNVNSSINSFGANLKQGLGIGAGIQIFQSLFDTIVGGFNEAIGMGWKFNSTMEQNLASFTTMLGGSQVEAEKMVASLTKMAQVTPFETADLTKNASLLMGFGVEAKKVEETLKMLGDVSLGNKERFNGLSLAFAQVTANGKLTGQEVLQMVNAGFNPLQTISKATGESMASLKDKMEKGAISTQMVTDALKSATSQGGLFYQAMDKQSKTFEGQMSTLKDAIATTFGVILKPLFDWVTTVGLPKLIVLTEDLKNLFLNFGQSNFVKEIQNLFTTLNNFYNNLKQKLTDIYNQIVKGAKDSFNNVINEGKKLWEAIDNYVIAIVGAITGLLLPAFIKMAVTSTIEMAKVVASWIAVSVQTLATSVVTTVKAIPSMIASFVSLSAGAVVNAGRVVASWVLMGVQSLLQAGRMALAWVIALGPIAWISAGIVAFAALLIANWDKVKYYTQVFVSKIVHYIKEFYLKMVEIGNNIVQGLWNGISDMYNWIKTKILGFVKGVGDVIKNFFGIASPSKLTTEYGKNISEGLANGIKDNSNLATDSAKEMADKVKEQFETLKTSVIDKANKMGEIIISALKKQYDAQEKIQTQSLNNQIKALTQATDLKIKQYDRELSSQLKLLDAGTSDRVKSLQSQIDALNKTTDDEEKALKEQEYQTKVANLQKKISETNSASEKISLQNDLNELIAQKQREHQLEVRSDLIKSLQNEIENIKNQNELKKEQLKIEFENKKENEKNLLDLKVNSLNEELNTVKKHYDELRSEESLQADARKLMLDKNNQDLINLLNNYAPNWKDAGKSFGEKLLEGINSQKQNIINAVNEMMAIVNRAGLPSQNVQNTISTNIQTPFKPFTFGGKIPALANGGIVNQPTLALIGESGSEAVIPLSQLGNYSGGTTVYVQLDGRTIAKASAPAMVRELKMQGVYV